MRYSYRGSSYEAKTAAVEVSETQEMGVFLGNPFPIKQLTVAHRQAPPTHLRYRGADYTC